MSTGTEKSERNMEMVQARLAGQSWVSIGRDFGIDSNVARKAIKRTAAKHGIQLPAIGSNGKPLPRVATDLDEVVVHAEEILLAACAQSADYTAKLQNSGRNPALWAPVAHALEQKGWLVGRELATGDFKFSPPDRPDQN